MHSAHEYAINRGKRTGIAEAKGPIANRVSELGMKLLEFKSAALHPERLSHERRAYYITPPAPRLYLFDLFKCRAALKEFLDRNVL